MCTQTCAHNHRYASWWIISLLLPPLGTMQKCTCDFHLSSMATVTSSFSWKRHALFAMAVRGFYFYFQQRQRNIGSVVVWHFSLWSPPLCEVQRCTCNSSYEYLHSVLQFSCPHHRGGSQTLVLGFQFADVVVRFVFLGSATWPILRLQLYYILSMAQATSSFQRRALPTMAFRGFYFYFQQRQRNIGSVVVWHFSLWSPPLCEVQRCTCNPSYE